MSLLLLALALTPISPARAAEVGVISEPRVDAQGFTVMTVLIDAPPDMIRLQADDTRSPPLNPDVVDVRLLERGECTRLAVRSKGGLSVEVGYEALRCPVAGGWRETLVASEDFRVYESEFLLLPQAQGALVVYRTRVSLDMPVPQWMQDIGLRRSMRTTLEQLVARTQDPPG